MHNVTKQVRSIRNKKTGHQNDHPAILTIKQQQVEERPGKQTALLEGDEFEADHVNNGRQEPHAHRKEREESIKLLFGVSVKIDGEKRNLW